MAMRTKVRAHWARLRFFFTFMVALSILGTLIYLLTGGGLLKAKATDTEDRVFRLWGLQEAGADEKAEVLAHRGGRRGRVGRRHCLGLFGGDAGGVTAPVGGRAAGSGQRDPRL